MIALSDALILGIYMTAFLGMLTVVGAIADPGGLWDRTCEWLGLASEFEELDTVTSRKAGR